MNTEYKAYIRVIYAPHTRKTEWEVETYKDVEAVLTHQEPDSNRSWQLQVYKIKWQGPHTPVGRWHRVKTLLSPLDENQVEKETIRLLKNKRHFGFCIKCKKHVIEGYMSTEEHCNSCAEKHLTICH